MLFRSLSKEELAHLIALAQSKPSKDEPTDLSSVEQWIISANIKPGDHCIKPYQLWYVYESWAQYPINKREFFREFKRVFKGERKRNSDTTFYLVDPAPFDLSLDTHFKMLARRREERDNRRKSRDAKKAKRQASPA